MQVSPHLPSQPFPSLSLRQPGKFLLSPVLGLALRGLKLSSANWVTWGRSLFYRQLTTLSSLLSDCWQFTQTRFALPSVPCHQLAAPANSGSSDRLTPLSPGTCG